MECVPVAGDETATLLGSLERQRATPAWKCGGLDAAGWIGTRPVCGASLIDVIDEYARHTGHADLIRESVNGLVGEDPPS